MKKLLKNPLFYVMYFIPQLIMTHAVSTFKWFPSMIRFPMGRHVLQIIIYIFMIGILMIFCACMK